VDLGFGLQQLQSATSIQICLPLLLPVSSLAHLSPVRGSPRRVPSAEEVDQQRPLGPWCLCVKRVRGGGVGRWEWFGVGGGGGCMAASSCDLHPSRSQRPYLLHSRWQFQQAGVLFAAAPRLCVTGVATVDPEHRCSGAAARWRKITNCAGLTHRCNATSRCSPVALQMYP